VTPVFAGDRKTLRPVCRRVKAIAGREFPGVTATIFTSAVQIARLRVVAPAGWRLIQCQFT